MLPKSQVKLTLPDGAFCDHTDMVECCPGCGHFNCPCGVSWDEGFEGDEYLDPFDMMVSQDWSVL